MNRALVAVLAVVLAVVVVVLAAGALAGDGVPTPSRGPTSRPSPSVRPNSTPLAVSSPSPTPADDAVVAEAVVVPTRSANLAVPITGRVSAILVEEDQQVAVNQLLARLDPATYAAAIDVAEADVRRTEEALARAQLQLELVPEDASPAQLETAQAEVRLAEAELALAQSRLVEAEVALRQTELRAPFAGSVISIDVAIGEQATAGQPIITIADISSWFIETTDLGEIDVVRIAVGDRATITFEALPDLVLGGSVERIQVRGTNDLGGVVFAVVIEPDSHPPNLRWNMTATIRIRPG